MSAGPRSVVHIVFANVPDAGKGSLDGLVLSHGKARGGVGPLDMVGRIGRDGMQIGLLLLLGSLSQATILGGVQVGCEAMCGSQKLIFDHAPAVVVLQARNHTSKAVPS